jgi:hypothetical protein
MLKSRFGWLVLTTVVAGVAAIGHSYAGGGGGGTKAVEATAAEGHCPFAAMRAWLSGTGGASRARTVQAEAALLAAEGASAAGAANASLPTASGTCEAAAAKAHLAAADEGCDADCPLGAAGAAFFRSMARGDITRQITKTADGVVIRISSKKPEKVKMIQTRFEPLFARNTPAVTPAKASSNEIARK